MDIDFVEKTEMKITNSEKKSLSIFFLAVLASLIFIIIIFFKFIPDIGTGVIQKSPSVLTSWEAYENQFLKPSSVHHARFLGNITVHQLARFLTAFIHNDDIRLHPLRISAALLTLVWFLVSLFPPFLFPSDLDWRVYLPTLALMFFAGLYVYYPCDAPALACLTLSIVFILKERMYWALLGMIVTGLFRESSFHVVSSIAIWAWCARHHNLKTRLLWLLIFILTFIFEYKMTRVFYPGVERGLEFYQMRLIENWDKILLGKGLISLTSLMSIPLALIYPISWWLLKHSQISGNWQQNFFAISCLAFPFWIFFYLVQDAGLAEFRVMWAFIIPCILGLAWNNKTNKKSG